jgi:hypothetical protein
MSGDPAQSPVVRQLMALPTDELFELYVELAAEDPDRADVAALAIREQGRAGHLGGHLVELLSVCVDMAPNLLVTGHLAKALAALGREAQAAAPSLVAALSEAPIKDDVDYWSFDGSVWALGYLGGPDARTFIADLANEKPSRAIRSQSLYKGNMGPADREKAFHKALAEATALLDKADPGTWRARKMEIKKVDAPKVVAKQKAWMLRT